MVTVVGTRLVVFLNLKIVFVKVDSVVTETGVTCVTVWVLCLTRNKVDTDVIDNVMVSDVEMLEIEVLVTVSRSVIVVGLTFTLVNVQSDSKVVGLTWVIVSYLSNFFVLVVGMVSGTCTEIVVVILLNLYVVEVSISGTVVVRTLFLVSTDSEDIVETSVMVVCLCLTLVSVTTLAIVMGSVSVSVTFFTLIDVTVVVYGTLMETTILSVRVFTLNLVSVAVDVTSLRTFFVIDVGETLIDTFVTVCSSVIVIGAIVDVVVLNLALTLVTVVGLATVTFFVQTFNLVVV